MWTIFCFRNSDDRLSKTIPLPRADDDTVRQILHQPDEPNIRFYVIDVAGRKEFDELVAYAQENAQFDESLSYQCEYDIPYGVDG